MVKKKTSTGRPIGAKDKKKRKRKAGYVPKPRKVRKGTKYDLAFIDGMAKKLVPWFKAKKTRFWLKDFAIEQGFPAQYMCNWSEKSELWKEQYELAKDIQESRLVHGGINGSMNEGMVRRALQNVAGWRDAKDLEVSGNLIFNIKKKYD